MARRRRRTRLVVGALAGVVLLGLVAAGAVRVNLWVQTRPVGTVDAPRSATAQQVRTGHCVQSLPDDGDVTRVRLVPCDEPHQAEVIGTLDLTGAGGSGTDWPGQEQVQRRVTASCEMASDQRELGLVAVVWSPTEAGWAQGDRAGLCLTAAPSGTVVGSFSAGQDVHR